MVVIPFFRVGLQRVKSVGISKLQTLVFDYGDFKNDYSFEKKISLLSTYGKKTKRYRIHLFDVFWMTVLLSGRIKNILNNEDVLSSTVAISLTRD